MRVGVDLTALPSLKGGVAFYLLELVGALARMSSGPEIQLLARREHSQQLRQVAPGLEVVGYDLPSRPLRLAWEQFRLPREVRRLRLDVLHSPHYTRPLGVLQCASVVGIMDLTMLLLPRHHRWEKRLFFRGMIPAAVRRADRLIAISESTKADLVRWLKVDEDRIDVTPLAAGPQFRTDHPLEAIADVRRRYDLPERFVLFVGRLEPRKNVPRLLEAYRHLRAAMPGAPPLVLAGAPGWHSSALMAELRRAPQVIALGYVSDTDLPLLYAAATVFVYPSIYEGFGIPVLEALATGTPTITSGRSSMPEVAGDAALLVDPEDPLELAAAMCRLLTDDAVRADLRRRGPIRARHFSWDRTARLTVASYMKAVSDKRRTS